MELRSRESTPQEEIGKIKETILPPEIIRPLGRATRQALYPSIKVIRKAFKKLESSSFFSQQHKQLINSAIDEFSDRLNNLEKAKEVKLVEEPTDDPDRLPTFGIECSEELERNIKIPTSTTVIDKALLEKLGPALQDYLLNSFTPIKMQPLPFPDKYNKYREEIGTQYQIVIATLRNMTRVLRLTIENNRDKSKFNFKA